MMHEDADLLADCSDAALGRHDPWAWRHTIDEFWHYVRPAGRRTPKQGWKLHVPATPLSACVVLSRCVEVFAEHRCAFKFAKTMRQLQLLLEPNADRTSAGKFVTAYPVDDEHAVRVAAALHEATLGLPGQLILTDRRFRSSSQVFYRYGPFVRETTLTDDGEYAPILRDGNGDVVVDRRGIGRPVPDWLSDPFQDKHIEPAKVPRSVRIGGRFQVREAIRQSNRGGVYLATDTETGTEVILKRFRRFTAAAVDGTDSLNRARAEARTLDALGPIGATPRLLGLLNENGDMFVAVEKVSGVPLRRFVARNLRPTASGALAMDSSVVLDLATQLVDLIAEVHAAGYVLGDLTPNNVMVTDEGRLVLIDLESALRSWEVTVRLTTKAYTAPEEIARTRLVAPAPAVTADLYGLGATLMYLASGSHPPTAEGARVVDLVERMAVRNPVVAALRPVITELLADDPAARPSLADVRARLREPVDLPPGSPQPVDPPPGSPPPGSPLPISPLSVDGLIEDMLAAIGETMTPDARWLWRPTVAGRRYDPCSVQLGAAGVLAVLNQAVRAGEPVPLSTVDSTARWIVGRLGAEAKVLPGLLFGRAGTAVTLFESGELLGDASISDAGLGLAHRLPTRWPVPDVFHGLAGAGLALLRLWRATGSPELLDRARGCAEEVLGAMRADGARVSWTATGESTLAGEVHWGFAHGVAGIGSFLLDAAGGTGDERYADVARRCAETLAGVVDRDGAAAFWAGGEPDENADAVRLTGLCNGSTGVGTFLLRYFVATGSATARELAEAAAVAVRCANWTAHPVWCHGLASDGDFLLDCAQVLGEPRYRDWAEETAEVIAARTVVRGGRRLTPDESGNVGASFGNGYAGALSFLLRLRHGGERPLIGSPATSAPAVTAQMEGGMTR
ncbi:class IV lanthionine synthetase LanL [Actinophytocola sp.]|uniref:class IV lanthionine synthetase LanL n=1 Tax=Actinophytocola sp. TaxID=1872138 RepID=UPI002ED8EE56